MMRIEKFGVDDNIAYKLLERKFLGSFNNDLPPQKIFEWTTIYLLIIRSKFLKKDKVIGRSIIVDLNKVDNDDIRNTHYYLNHVPIELNYNDLIIEDLYIMRSHRNRGYGKWFVNEIMNELNNHQLVLHADGDGRWFWPTIGFKLIDGCDDVYTYTN